jgi:hypothetical protein
MVAALLPRQGVIMPRKANRNSGGAKDKGKSESPRDLRKVGTTSIEGVEAHDLPAP